MRKVEFIPFILNDNVDIYTIRFEGDCKAEMEKFIFFFKDSVDPHLQRDYSEIIMSLMKMREVGVKESFFRYEGKMNDRVCAIPLYSGKDAKGSGTLRLYCLRLSDSLLVIGGGGIKNTRTYEENESLLQIVETLQQIDIEFLKLEKEGFDIQKEILNLVLEIE